MIDAKKQNKIIVGSAVILIALVWVGYLIFTLLMDEHYMSAGASFTMASALVIAMVAGTWIRVNEAVAYTEQIPMVPQKTEEEYVGLKTHAGKAIWLLYRACGNIHPHEFYLWVHQNLKWRYDGEKERDLMYRKYANDRTPGGDVEGYLFSDVKATHMPESIGDGEIRCFVFEFWDRLSDGSKKWVRVYVTEAIGELHFQMGKSDSHSESMLAIGKPVLIDKEELKKVMGELNVQ